MAAAEAPVPAIATPKQLMSPGGFCSTAWLVHTMDETYKALDGFWLAFLPRA
jgi:hypothetical protein